MSNSSCKGFSMAARAESHRLRCALPYLSPFTVQVASEPAVGTLRSTIIPAKPSHSGSLPRTALVIAISRATREMVTLFAFKILFETWILQVSQWIARSLELLIERRFLAITKTKLCWRRSVPSLPSRETMRGTSNSGFGRTAFAAEPGLQRFATIYTPNRRISSRYSCALRFQENSAALFRPCAAMVARRSSFADRPTMACRHPSASSGSI